MKYLLTTLAGILVVSASQDCNYAHDLRVDYSECDSYDKRKAFFYWAKTCTPSENLPLPEPFFDIDCRDTCKDGE
jgi:hypothetical protein